MIFYNNNEDDKKPDYAFRDSYNPTNKWKYKNGVYINCLCRVCQKPCQQIIGIIMCLEFIEDLNKVNHLKNTTK